MTTRLQDIGEAEAIRRLVNFLPQRSDVLTGAGDDTAVVALSDCEDLLLTSDPVIEGIHFEAGVDSELIGNKALGRVLSDIAAMGGEPLWVLVDIVAPADMPISLLERIYVGMSELARRHKVAIVGGDTAEGRQRELHVFGVGRLPHNSAVLRAGAQAGDLIYATGSLGNSLHGRHLTFDPRILEGLWLREGGWPTAMTDISDGLAVDLGHILDAGSVGAELFAESIPVVEAQQDGRTLLEHALYDGEDYELLFTLPSAKQADFEKAWLNRFDLACTNIGKITASEVMVCIDSAGERELVNTTYDHHFNEV